MVIFEPNWLKMDEKKQILMSDQEFLEVLGRAYEENKEILTIGNTNEGLQEAIDDVVDYHQTIIDASNLGKTTIDSQCLSNA